MGLIKSFSAPTFPITTPMMAIEIVPPTKIYRSKSGDDFIVGPGRTYAKKWTYLGNGEHEEDVNPADVYYYCTSGDPRDRIVVYREPVREWEFSNWDDG